MLILQFLPRPGISHFPESSGFTLRAEKGTRSIVGSTGGDGPTLFTRSLGQ